MHMNSSDSIQCAVLRVAFSSLSRDSACSRMRIPESLELVASKAACSRFCSAVSAVTVAWSPASDDCAWEALRASAAEAAAIAASRSDFAAPTTPDCASAAALALWYAVPVPACPVPHVPFSSHCACAPSCWYCVTAAAYVACAVETRSCTAFSAGSSLPPLATTACSVATCCFSAGSCRNRASASILVL
jgi:hypothetical protein